MFPVKAGTCFHTIEKLRKLFSWFGLPHKIVSDNDSVFTSQQFQELGIMELFMSRYHHITHHLTDSLREQFNFQERSRTTNCKLSKVLFNYRVTPQFTTTKSPAEILLGWKLKSQLDLLHPDLQVKIEFKVKKQKEADDRPSRFRESIEEDTVFIRNYRTGPKWI